MINPKFYKLVGWGMIISSFYFTWWVFPVVAVILYNLATNGGFGITHLPRLPTDETLNYSGSLSFFLEFLVGLALIVGGIFVLKRMGTRIKGV